MNGYILISRKILNSDIWHKPPLYVKVWLFLLMKAEYQDRGNLKRGQLFTSINEIAEECSYHKGFQKVTPSHKEIWNVLEYLRSPERDNEGDMKGMMIVTTKVTHGMLVTICNYNLYQDPSTYEGNDERDTKGIRREWQGNNIIKNIKNKEKEIFTYSDRLKENHDQFKSIKAALMKGE